MTKQETTDWPTIAARLRKIADGLRAIEELREGPRHRRAFARYVAAEREVIRNAE